ncbi:MAG: catalase, partial [Myxococcota bacterium]
LLINQPAFVFGTGDTFARFMIARARGGLSLFRFLVEWKGWWGAFGAVRQLQAMVARLFTGFATQAFYSAAPIQCGPYAVRVRLQPAREAVERETRGEPDFGGDLERHLASGELVYALQLQFFVDEATTPIEDASVDWPEDVAPYTTVARLTIAPDALDQARDPDFVEQVEREAYDPWKALAVHRPLGNVMRVRKATYYPSYTARS